MGGKGSRFNNHSLSRPGAVCVRRWVPDWVHTLVFPVWICDPGFHLTFINSYTEELLGVAGGDLLGHSCDRIVSGLGKGGEPVCGPNCPVRKRLARGFPIPPFEVQVTDGMGETRWFQIVVIVTAPAAGEDLHLVHFALSRERAHRVEDYLGRVATRSRGLAGSGFPGSDTGLTPREREILSLLAQDLKLREIAELIHVSYATVRNHIQRILFKLGVRSISEAVALYILDKDL